MREARGAPGAARVVDAGRGVGWWSDAWTLFRQSPGIWIGLAVVSIAIFVLLEFIPVLGPIAASLVSPALAGGWMIAARKAESGATIELGDLFAGFREKLTPLLIQGALLVVASLVTVLLVGALGAGALVGALLGAGATSPEALMAALSAGLMALLVGLAISVVVAMAIWFAPALVVFRDAAPLEAMKASFSASLSNTGPFLLYGLVFVVIAILASIPFGLGWIVLVPAMALSVYVSYRDVFGE